MIVNLAHRGRDLTKFELLILMISEIVCTQTIFSCGGCTWYTDDDGVLSMEGGSSGCGESCHHLDMRNKGITSIAPGAFNSTGLSTGAWKIL
jgi:hypothetical protein